MTGELYLIGVSGFFKIGKTRNWSQRKKYYKTHSPLDIAVIKVVRAREYEKHERLLHTRYKKSRIKGEWFRFTQKEIDEILVYFRKVENLSVSKLLSV